MLEKPHYYCGVYQVYSIWYIVRIYGSGEVLLPILYSEIFIRTNMLPTTYKYDLKYVTIPL